VSHPVRVAWPSGVLPFAIVAAGLLGVSVRHAAWSLDQQQGWRWCLEDPVARDGSRLVLPLWTVSGIDGPDRYRISKVVKDIPVRGPSVGLAIGDTISIEATFDAATVTAVEHARELHPLRRWKEGLGVLGFVLVALAAPFAFRVARTPEGRRLEERWRI
jgi:hypothetical protein